MLSSPFICRRCLVRVANQGYPRAGSPSSSRLGISLRRWATTQSTHHRNIRASPPPPKQVPDPSPDSLSSTRRRLQQWDLEYGKVDVVDLPVDLPIYGTISNTLNRTQATGSSATDQLRPGVEGDGHGTGGEASSEEDGGPAVGLDTRQPGDLVELRQFGSRISLCAIYLGFFSGFNHFFVSNGRWTTSLGYSFAFSVSQFADPSELKPILDKIPNNVTPEGIQGLRRNFGGPSRADGAHLIRKMADFKTRADTILQEHLGSFEDARTRLSHRDTPRYLSLSSIAETLLPKSLLSNGRFSSHVLYATHLALRRQDVGFRLINASSDCHHPDHMLEIFPRKHTLVIDNVAAMVREYTEARTRFAGHLDSDQLDRVTLGTFIKEAREVVIRSRGTRAWTPHGVLGSSYGIKLWSKQWSRPSLDVLSCLEWWACHDMFNVGSCFHSTGAIILRSLYLYPDVVLDQSIAWTFLQEIGRIPPWEVPSRYKPQLPGVSVVRGGGLDRQLPPPRDVPTRQPDIAADVRHKRLGGATVFCIDAPSTRAIDDGISLERTARPDEFWVHVHVADPASTIRPDSSLRDYMELIPENVYLPGHFQAMIPSDLWDEDGYGVNVGSGDGGNESGPLSGGLVAEYSLRSQGPTLTFSAKMNRAGDVLDCKIEPGTLNEVVYMDPQDVSGFCNEAPPPAPVRIGHSLVVGRLPPSASPTEPGRPMVAAADLGEDAKSDLLLLHRLAEAARQRRLAKGAWPQFFPRPSVSVRFPSPPAMGEDWSSEVMVPPDPYIEVKREASTPCTVVSSLMVLAGEVATRWCAERGVPIPYRRDSKLAQNRKAALALASSEIYPLLGQGLEPSLRHRQELINLTGGVELSTQPGPYFLLGLDMYAKATSPLRRFSDMLLHWQVHAALAFERRTGRRMTAQDGEGEGEGVGDDGGEAVLPFSARTLDTTLRLLQMREKKARAMARGTVDWILMALVRAWRVSRRGGPGPPLADFDVDRGERQSLPPTLRFTVSMRLASALYGRLDLFDLDAMLDVEGLDGLRLIKEVRLGDQFEVELKDINVHSRQILVRATRYLGQPGVGVVKEECAAAADDVVGIEGERGEMNLLAG